MPETLKLGLKLFVISAVAALALAVTNEVTKGPIKQQEIAATNAARFAVFADADSFSENSAENGIEIYNALDASGNVIGYTGKTLVTGYGGEIEVTVGTDAQGVISGVNVGGANFSETAGLGARTKEESFTSRFIGLKAPLYPAKGHSASANGEERPAVTVSEAGTADISEMGVDVITSATVSSSAVINAVSEGAMCILNLLQNP